jgi:hypothetical protein
LSGEKERTFREKTTKRGGRAHWTGERREKKTKIPEEERTNKAGFFSEAEKNHRKQREHKQRRKKTKELGM